MSDPISHDSSKPPPAPQSTRAPSPERVAESAELGRGRSKLALQTAQEALDVGREIRALLGASPDPARGVEGSPGLLLGVSRLHSRLDALESKLEERDKIAREIAAAERAQLERRGTVARWILLALGAVGTALGIWRGTR